VKCYYFYDCPRTGGTSFKKWCRDGNAKRIYYGDRKGWHHVPFKPRSEVCSLVPPNYNLWTFTLLRDPVEHTASLYAKIREHKHSYCANLRGLSFNDWITGPFEEDSKTSPDPWGFSFVRFYDPDTHNLEKAISNIESMDFVGFTERLGEDVNLMLRESGSKTFFNNRKLNSKARNFIVSDSEKEIIKRVRSDDYKLVNNFRTIRNLPKYE